jgi:hypothetical protein
MDQSYGKHGEVEVVYRISFGKPKPSGNFRHRQGSNVNIRIMEWCGLDRTRLRFRYSDRYL